MIKFRKLNFLILFVLLLCPFLAVNASTQTEDSAFDWDAIIEAIIEVESNGNPCAKSGNSAGAMQITPMMVKECNNILKSRKSKKRYTLSDRFSVKKSKEMFLLFQSKFNVKNDVEQAIRSWNGGIRYTIKGTQRYYEKVMAAID